ncbi:TcfC E-set like domain-containing protein [Providencia alcalifaciens]|uniref:TcfC E-set like domain-containing protein n=1 Tax=Providencia alcalifaciens TaxID=126385 RepID=UPI000449249E|nr:TcfC E-set like domain-containing protein [Providencia alcalifaciens]EUD07292.1 hypothetical protein HMPREF1564_3843 [Providencia alcalifaciens R90-1475]
MFKYSLIALCVTISINQCIAKDIDLAMHFSAPQIPKIVTFASGENLPSSRYANIVIPSEKNVKLIFEGVSEQIISADMAIDSVKFKDINKLENFFAESGINEKHIKKIINQNNKFGFIHSSKCKGARSECIINSEAIDFVIDYYNSTIRIFISPELLKKSIGEKKILQPNGQLGVVNNISAYYYNQIKGNTSPSYYIRDQGNAGIRSGFIKYNYYRSNSQSQVDDLYYSQALINDNKILLGKAQSSSNFNASSNQSLLANTTMNGMRIGNTNELIDSSYGNKIFRYYSPSDGTLEVRRNGELVYAIASRAGYNDINLSNLPEGQYNADIQIKSATGNIVSSQIVQINNSNSFYTDFSYHVFAGKSSSGNDILNKNQKIIDAGFQLPISSFGATYLGATLLDNDKAISTGINMKNNLGSLSAKLGIGNDNFRYYEVNAYTKNLSLSYKNSSNNKGWRGENEKNDDSLFSVNYNLNISSELSLSTGYMYSSNLINTYNNDYLSQVLGQAHVVERNKTQSIYSNVFFNIGKGSSIYLNTNKQLGSNNYNLSLGINIPIGNNFNINNTSYYNDNHRLTNGSTINYSSNITDSTSQTISAGVNIADHNYNSLSYNLSHNNLLFRGSASGYITDNGQKQVTFSGESTQIINKNGVYFTPSFSNDSAYLIKDNSTKYNVSVKNLSNNSTRYFDDKTEILSVPTYQKHLVTSSTDGVDLVFEDRYPKKTEMYTLVPGSTVTISQKTIETNSIIVTLKDKKGEYVNTASCASNNCISISRLNRGVFKVKHTGSSLKIKSDDKLCHIKNNSKNERFYHATCKQPTK